MLGGCTTKLILQPVRNKPLGAEGSCEKSHGQLVVKGAEIAHTRANFSNFQVWLPISLINLEIL